MLSTGAGSPWEAIESLKEDVDNKFGEFWAASKHQSAQLEDLRTMVLHLLDNQNLHMVRSPSMGQSALEDQENLHLPRFKGANRNPTSRNTGNSIPSAVAKNAPSAKEKRGPAAEIVSKRAGPVNLSATVVTLESSQTKPTPLEPADVTSPPTGKSKTNPLKQVAVDPEVQSGAGPLPGTSLLPVQDHVSEKPPPGAEVTVDLSPEAAEEHASAQEDGTIKSSSGGASPKSSDNEGSGEAKGDGESEELALEDALGPGGSMPAPTEEQRTEALPAPTEEQGTEALPAPMEEQRTEALNLVKDASPRRTRKGTGAPLKVVSITLRPESGICGQCLGPYRSVGYSSSWILWKVRGLAYHAVADVKASLHLQLLFFADFTRMCV